MPSTAEEAPPPQPLQGLLRTLFSDAETLLLQQFALLRAELGEAADRLIQGSVILLIGVEVGLAGIVILITALIVLAANIMPLWVACISVAVLTLIAAAVLIVVGRRTIARAGLMPKRSGKILRETVDWFEDELT